MKVYIIFWDGPHEIKVESVWTHKGKAEKELERLRKEVSAYRFYIEEHFAY